MSYKVELFTEQAFSNGDVFNNREEHHFSNDHELTANTEAFNFAFSHDPKPQTSIEFKIFFGVEYGCENLLLCTLILHPLEEYSIEELTSKKYYFYFDLNNLHEEHLEYKYYSFDTGGEPLLLENELIIIYDEIEDVEINTTPKVLSVYRNLLS